MKRLWLCSIAAAFCLAMPRQGFADADLPDYRRAYMLAIAAYCSYAVTELEPDRGQSRARRCLKAAARDDKGLRDALGETPDIEVYFDPRSPENAYLLARIRAGVILAFRGTLTPPIDPKGNIFEATAESARKYNERALSGLRSFIADWLTNVQAGATAQGRHKGFDEAWQGLLTHLKTACPAAGPSDNCSRFSSFIAGLNSALGENIYITGHSKGGALATLAAVDIPQSFPAAPITYVFSAAKAITLDKTAEITFPTGSLWRFERSDDIVPALPPDKSFGLWRTLGMKPYAHVGELILFDGSLPPRLMSRSAEGLYRPTDTARIVAILEGAAISPLKILLDGLRSGDPGEMLTNILNLGENGCRKFVDSHFQVFANVQAQVGEAKNVGGLFVERLKDERGDVLWGYREWCSLVGLVK